MIKKINFNISNICELLIISLPVCLLFSNIISEIIVFVLFLIIGIYLIIDYFVNFLKNPDFLRSFFLLDFHSMLFHYT